MIVPGLQHGATSQEKCKGKGEGEGEGCSHQEYVQVERACNGVQQDPKHAHDCIAGPLLIEASVLVVIHEEVFLRESIREHRGANVANAAFTSSSGS